MKKHRKRLVILSSMLLSLILIVGLGYIFRQPLLNQAQRLLTAQTIPFHWVVDPNKVENGLNVPAVDLSVSQMDDVKKDALKLVSNIDENFSGHQSDFMFLTAAQRKQLDRWVHDKPHQYIYSITPVAFGKIANQNYLVLSANRYDDTKTIVSYRYRIFYNAKFQIDPKKTEHVATVKHENPPKFLFADASVGTDGISTATNFIERIKNELGNSNTYTNSTKLTQFRGLAQELNLNVHSAKALQRYLQVSDTDFQNTVITGYELTDVPRVTRFFIVSGTNKQKTYFTLTYDRTQEGFTDFQNGIVNADKQK